MTVCLVVEDEPAILRLVTLILLDLGCDVIEAPDAETALDLIRRDKPALILADVRLPGMDGVELAQRVKTDRELGETPVLLMSAYGEPSPHPGDGFLAKPFDVDRLQALVEPYLQAAS